LVLEMWVAEPVEDTKTKVACFLQRNSIGDGRSDLREEQIGDKRRKGPVVHGLLYGGKPAKPRQPATQRMRTIQKPQLQLPVDLDIRLGDDALVGAGKGQDRPYPFIPFDRP